MHSIPVTQYHLPNGRRTQESFETDSEAIAKLAERIIERGGRFEAEILRTGEVSLTVAGRLADPTQPGTTFESDIAIAVCRNEPQFVKNALERIIAKAAQRLSVMIPPPPLKEFCVQPLHCAGLAQCPKEPKCNE